MRYMGGKSRIAKEVIGAILADGAPRDRWFEPFVGGGNIMVEAAPVFGKCLGMDAHLDLIMMWRKVTEEYWSPPHTVTPEQYAALRHAESSALRGFVGFGCSFGGKWFGGYAQPYKSGRMAALEGTNVIARQGATYVKHGVTFRHGSFGSVRPSPGTVLYCDPPYAGTTEYKTATFDHADFYRRCVEYADSGAYVYVSEYTIPADVPHRVVWTKEIQAPVGNNNRRATENLYRIGV